MVIASDDPIELSNMKLLVIGVILIFTSNLMWLFADFGAILGLFGYFSSMGSQGSLRGDSVLADLAMYLALISDIVGFSLFGIGLISNRSTNYRSLLLSGGFFVSWALIASIWRVIFFFYPISVITNMYTADGFNRIIDFFPPLRVFIGILFSLNGLLMLLGIYFFNKSKRHPYGFGFHIIFVEFILADPTYSPPILFMSFWLKCLITPLIGVISFYKTKLISIKMLLT
jgi:hypothetical protein